MRGLYSVIFRHAIADLSLLDDHSFYLLEDAWLHCFIVQSTDSKVPCRFQCKVADGEPNDWINRQT
jgi:hypothetical protein